MPAPATPSPPASITIRISPELLAAVEAQAKAERRTRSQMIRIALEEFVAHRPPTPS